MQIKDTVAVITGGASGLGRATAERLVAAGGKVALLDLNEDLANATAAELGGDAKAYAVNVTEADSIVTALDQVMEDFGAIHINVNCAGIGAASRTVGKDGAMKLDYFNFVVQVNLIGTFNTLSQCAARMQLNEPVNEDGERGVIINTASVAAFDGQIGQAAYSASKAGVAGMTLPIARDLSRIGVRICTIAPGIFETPMMMGAPDQVRQPLIDMVQFPKRLGEAPEFALLSQQIVENPYLNGETIRLDGGIRMQPK
ncbi:MAG: SDR family NAD(P)-dependent oxidoreductase [Pseudomonadaceae bacterium]|nr:SDR family NAD(P)-dependent oxidoreductase [Pseudomonadaceae bacterium]